MSEDNEKRYRDFCERLADREPDPFKQHLQRAAELGTTITLLESISIIPRDTEKIND